MKNTVPTRGQLERQLSQNLQSIYRQQFGHTTGKITCNLLVDKVAIIAEDTVIKLERVLLDNDRAELAGELRSAINNIFKAQITQTVAELMQVEVVDIVYDFALSSGCLGALVLLNNKPHVRKHGKDSIGQK